jgi:hypothetical protein
MLRPSRKTEKPVVFCPISISREEISKLILKLENKMPEGFSKNTRGQMESAKQQLNKMLASAPENITKLTVNKKQLEFCQELAEKTPNAVHYERIAMPSWRW